MKFASLLVCILLFSAAFIWGDKLFARNQASFSVIVLPDTQYYSKYNPNILNQQIDWIKSKKYELNIKQVIHLGDIVDDVGSKRQWGVATKAFKELKGVVPLGIAPGNHDLYESGLANAHYNEIARDSVSRVSGTHAGFITSNGKNNYHVFKSDGQEYLVVNIELCPDNNAIKHINNFLSNYKNTPTILATHAFLRGDGQRDDESVCRENASAGMNAGQQIWSRIIDVEDKNGIFLVLNGHYIDTRTGGAQRVDEVQGRKVFQVLSNYQHLGEGGDGYLRTMTFKPQEREIQVKTFSPYLNEYATDKNNQFILKL